MIHIRQADLAADRAGIIDFLFRHLTPLSNERRFDWLYRECPEGLARVWIASRAADGVMAGVGAAFPRCAFRGNQEFHGYVLGDFCVSPEHRSLGPALQLQRACLSAVEEDRPFCYDFPSLSMLPVYRRLKVGKVVQMVRWAKPLRIDRKVRQAVKAPILARILSSAGNKLLPLLDRRQRSSSDVDIELHPGKCGEEFTALARQVGGEGGFRIQRSASYLNWRYLNHPFQAHQILTARRNRELLAYAVFNWAGEDASLTDLFGKADDAAIGALLSHLSGLMRQRGVVTLSAWMSETHPWKSFLVQNRFVQREKAPLIVHVRWPGKEEQEPVRWLIVHGDRDS